MARAMNVGKRVDALRAILAKLGAYSDKAEQFAEELSSSFGEDKTPQGKQARQLARTAHKLAGAIQRVSDSVKL